MANDSTLDKELAFFNVHREEYLSKWKGQFVLIKNDEFLGVYSSAEAAYADGLQKVGLEPFLVKQVVDKESVGYIPILSMLS